jgi:hypothetical protein
MLNSSLRLRHWLAGSIIFIATQAQAVAPVVPHDQATVTLAPGAGWDMIANVLQDDPSTAKFQKTTPLPAAEIKRIEELPKPSGRNAPPPPATEIIQTLSKRTQAKPIHVPTNAFIKQMSDILAKGLSGKGCETGVPFEEPQAGDRFHLWAQVFQCEKSQLTGIQYYIDADAKNVYLITYTNTQYPFTGDSRKAAETLIKGSIQICYADKCYPLQ